ncbi:unnamed protein product, partial [Porites evermanni]
HTVCNAKLDLVVVVDTVPVVRRGFSFIRRFLLQLVDSFTISVQNVRLGLVVSSNRPQVKLTLGQYNSRKRIKRILGLLQPFGTARRTGMALKLALRRIFAAGKGKKTLILVTAGRSSDRVLGPIQRLVAKGVDVFSVGVGPAAVLSEILTTAKDPQHAYKISFKGLATIVKRIADKVCAGLL